jgi:hypothetical protein
MKSKIISALLAVLLSISITGCSRSKDSLNLSDSSNVIDNKNSSTNVPASSSSSSKNENTKTQLTANNPIFEAYKKVLQNKTDFFSTDNKKKLNLNNFLTNKELYGTTFKVTRFKVLDMDGDKVPEVILELSVGDEPQFYEVLHYMNDEVYGYLIVYRGLEELKEDGTFRFSSGAADNGWGKLKFELNTLKTDILGCSKSRQGNTLTISYFINDKPVTKEVFESFNNEQARKKDAVWYEFSQKNIEAELLAKP